MSVEKTLFNKTKLPQLNKSMEINQDSFDVKNKTNYTNNSTNKDIDQPYYFLAAETEKTEESLLMLKYGNSTLLNNQTKGNENGTNLIDCSNYNQEDCENPEIKKHCKNLCQNKTLKSNYTSKLEKVCTIYYATTNCSHSCGGGIQEFTRKCVSSQKQVTYESRQKRCNLHSCNISYKINNLNINRMLYFK